MPNISDMFNFFGGLDYGSDFEASSVASDVQSVASSLEQILPPEAIIEIGEFFDRMERESAHERGKAKYDASAAKLNAQPAIKALVAKWQDKAKTEHKEAFGKVLQELIDNFHGIVVYQGQPTMQKSCVEQINKIVSRPDFNNLKGQFGPSVGSALGGTRKI